jgi:hypothetical protein
MSRLCDVWPTGANPVCAFAPALSVFVPVVRKVVLVMRIIVVFTGGGGFGFIFLPPQLNFLSLLVAPARGG